MVEKKGRKLTRYNAWLDRIEAEHPELYRVIKAEYQNSINSQIEARKRPSARLVQFKEAN